jgi:hypothetical protein
MCRCITFNRPTPASPLIRLRPSLPSTAGQQLLRRPLLPIGSNLKQLRPLCRLRQLRLNRRLSWLPRRHLRRNRKSSRSPRRPIMSGRLAIGLGMAAGYGSGAAISRGHIQVPSGWAAIGADTATAMSGSAAAGASGPPGNTYEDTRHTPIGKMRDLCQRPDPLWPNPPPPWRHPQTPQPCPNPAPHSLWRCPQPVAHPD